MKICMNRQDVLRVHDEAIKKLEEQLKGTSFSAYEKEFISLTTLKGRREMYKKAGSYKNIESTRVDSEHYEAAYLIANIDDTVSSIGHD